MAPNEGYALKDHIELSRDDGATLVVPTAAIVSITVLPEVKAREWEGVIELVSDRQLPVKTVDGLEKIIRHLFPRPGRPSVTALS